MRTTRLTHALYMIISSPSYSANVMKLAIVTKDSLDRMAALAVELFKAVPNKNLPAQVFPNNPYPSELHMVSLIYVSVLPCPFSVLRRTRCICTSGTIGSIRY